MRMVHRFEFNKGNEFKASFNRDAKVVMVQQRGETISVWIEYDLDYIQNYNWELRLFATGEIIPKDTRTNARDDWRHQASCCFDETEFWHLYIRVSYA